MLIFLPFYDFFFPLFRVELARAPCPEGDKEGKELDRAGSAHLDPARCWAALVPRHGGVSTLSMLPRGRSRPEMIIELKIAGIGANNLSLVT